GVLVHGGKAPVLQVWTRDGARMLRQQAVTSSRAVGRGPEHLTAVAGGYLLSAAELAWVPASADGPVWRFGFGDVPTRALPRLDYANASLFGKPVVKDNLVFAGCRDGGVYVFDLGTITRR
ncbi:MAG TPA: PQQ-binding-like beta-propeller repeat protein, partial [Gemmataceae bacterium]|nr:PQQ-binding-like beta-propeller repeat protein [Gemmataceae bacterium]